DAGPAEPPTDSNELIQLMREFARAKLEREEQNFRTLQRQVQQKPNDDAVAKLHMLKPVISALRDRLDELNERLKKDQPVVVTLQMFTERQLSQPLRVNGRYLYS